MVGIIYKIIGNKTEINYRGYVVLADGIADGKQWCERYLEDNVLFSIDYIKHYIDELYEGDYNFVGKVSDDVWEFDGGIFVHRHFAPELVEETGELVTPMKCFTLPNDLVAARVI